MNADELTIHDVNKDDSSVVKKGNRPVNHKKEEKVRKCKCFEKMVNYLIYVELLTHINISELHYPF